MRLHSRTVLGSVVGVAILMIAILGFHLGGPRVLQIGLYSQLIGAFIAGALALLSVNLLFQPGENAELWIGRERFAWSLIGAGCILWGLGECFWRYYLSIGQNPFPSLADLGYSSLPPLVFLGLLLQPSSGTGRRRLLVLLDSFISMGSILAIAWFLLLGSLAQAPGEATLAKFLGLYYPTTDIALLSCVVFLLLRGQEGIYQAPARRTSLLVLGLGLCVFATSDFLFNVQQNAGTYVDGTWIDLGWPLGMMTMGVAAYLRRFLPGRVGSVSEEHMGQLPRWFRLRAVQMLPYLLVAALFLVLAFNVLSTEKSQQSIRPVLLLVTLIVIGLVIVRQMITMQENERLIRKQAVTLEQLENLHQDIAKRQATLEAGVTHLKDIQTRLANGDVRARAHATGNDLWSLAVGLNLMADRMMRSEQTSLKIQKLIKAVADLTSAFERHAAGVPFVVPASCTDFPDLHRLLWAIGLKRTPMAPQKPATPPAKVPPSNAASDQ
jgi:hypothetical protein